jgi:uncharacterized protein YwbE
MLENVTQGLGLGLILWNDQSNGKQTRNSELGMIGASVG